MTTAARVGRLVLLVIAMALATVAVGWWGLAVAAAAFALIDRRDRTAVDAGIAAGLGWGVLLLIAAARGEVTGVARAVSGAVGMPAAVLYITALVFPAVLAWSCASAVLLLARRRSTAASMSSAE